MHSFIGNCEIKEYLILFNGLFQKKKRTPPCVESFEVDKSGFMSYFVFFIMTSFKNFSLLIVEFSKKKFNVCFLKCLSTPCPSPLHWNKKSIFSIGRSDFCLEIPNSTRNLIGQLYVKTTGWKT